MKKDLRNIRNQTALNTAFQELLAEKPYSEITIRDITLRAELSRSTFYAYYESKEECLKTLFREAFTYACSGYPILFEDSLPLEKLNEAAGPDYYNRVQENRTIFLAAFTVFSFDTLTALCLPVMEDNFFILNPDLLLFRPEEAVYQAFKSTYAQFCLSHLYTMFDPPAGQALSKDQFMSLSRLWFYIMARFGGYCLPPKQDCRQVQ